MINTNLGNNNAKVERIVTGETHPYLGLIPAVGTIPLLTDLTGTITTDNAGASAGLTVLGSGTIFLTEVFPGDFIYNDDGAIRKVRYVFSDTMLELEEAFPASVSAIALQVSKLSYYNTVLVENTGASDGILQEAGFASGSKSVIEGGAPISYDATGTTLEFTCSR